MSDDPILFTRPLGFPWPCIDPFLFCAYHNDRYPAGNDKLGPDAPLAGRNLGMDFEGIDGWRMYHGTVVPGFPRHPHRGFETVTIQRRGFTDHSDSLGAAARFGPGDVQWITAGRGIVHSEMFPLLDRNNPNPLELFQIWLNLPSRDKMADPHFAMLWSESVPRLRFEDARGRGTDVAVVAGRLGDAVPPSPPPRSWAADPSNEVAIWTIRMAADATWTLPAVSPGTLRTLYFFIGSSLFVGGRPFTVNNAIGLATPDEVVLTNGPVDGEILLLQGRPIGEPVAQYGPFVMNTREELQQAFYDYQRTEFGGWPWPADDHVLPADAGRHARYIDGRFEEPAERGAASF
ncbi:MAG: pirin family protein [Gammaproteobacteria bacterium]